MNSFTHKRRYAVTFVLLLALALGSFVYISSAAGPALIEILNSAGDAVCPTDGAMAPSAVQGSPVGFSLSGFHADEGIAMFFTFPDGRTLDLPAVLALDGPVNILNANVAPAPKVDAGGELYFSYNLSQSWPVGCYTILAVGQSSGNEGKTELVIKPAPPKPPISSTLKVQRETDGAKEGERGDVITITGEGFAANTHIAITMTAPDGTIASFPAQPLTSASGKFTTTFQFTQASATGKYLFTAHDGSPDVQITAEFTLKPTPITPAGEGKLVVVVTSAAANPPVYRVEAQGQRFNPLEGVTLQLKFPRYAPASASDTVVELPLQRADAQGKFVFVFYLDERSPTGTYTITATGSDSKTKATKDFTIPPPATPVPTVIPTTIMTATTSPSSTVSPAASPTALPTTAPSAPSAASPTPLIIIIGTPTAIPAPTATLTPTATLMPTATATAVITCTATATPIAANATTTATQYVVVPPTVPGIETPSDMNPTATATPTAEDATSSGIVVDPPGDSASADPPDSPSLFWDP